MDLGPQLGVATAIVAAVFGGTTLMFREMRKMRAAVSNKKRSLPPAGSSDLSAIVSRLEEAITSHDYATRCDLDKFKADVDRRFESQSVVLREIEVCVRRLEGRMER